MFVSRMGMGKSWGALKSGRVNLRWGGCRDVAAPGTGHSGERKEFKRFGGLKWRGELCSVEPHERDEGRCYYLTQGRICFGFATVDHWRWEATMIAKLLEMLTGKDDLERVAYKEDLGLLNDYLKTRRLLFPKKPRRFLDAATVTQEQLLEMVEQESEELAGDQIELWILDIDGKKRLPAFSSQKSMQAFASRMSQHLNKVFSLGCCGALLADVAKQSDIDFVDLNLFSKKSWEIGVRKKT
ncbi:MAG: hypothetical protein AB1705_11285 [Verrucomicrobiota bacterium]